MESREKVKKEKELNDEKADKNKKNVKEEKIKKQEKKSKEEIAEEYEHRDRTAKEILAELDEIHEKKMKNKKD